MNPKEFGQYLKSLRNKKEITLTELGDKIGYSNPYLSQIETGKKGIPKPDLLKKLSTALEVDYLTLLHKAGYLVPEMEASELAQFGIGHALQDGKFFKRYIALEPHLLDEFYEFSYEGKKLTMDQRKELLNYAGYLIAKEEANKEKEE